MIQSLEIDNSLPSTYDIGDILNIDFALLSVYTDGKILLESDKTGEVEFESEEAFFNQIIYDESKCMYCLTVEDENSIVEFQIREDMYILLDNIFEE